MNFSAEERAFLDGLGLSAESVGDGTDAKPMWIAVDVKRQRVYKVFGVGRCEGFAEERGDSLVIFNGNAVRRPGLKFPTARQVSAGGGEGYIEDDETVLTFGLPIPDED